MEIPDNHNYANEEAWPLDALKHHARTMILEQEVANPRKAAELEATIGHAVFEIHFREAVDVRAPDAA